MCTPLPDYQSVTILAVAKDPKQKENVIVAYLGNGLLSFNQQYLITLVSSCRPRGFKTFFMLNSTQHEISTAHKTKIPTNEEVSSVKSLRCCIYHANKC